MTSKGAIVLMIIMIIIICDLIGCWYSFVNRARYTGSLSTDVVIQMLSIRYDKGDPF